MGATILAAMKSEMWMRPRPVEPTPNITRFERFPGIYTNGPRHGQLEVHFWSMPRIMPCTVSGFALDVSWGTVDESWVTISFKV